MTSFEIPKTAILELPSSRRHAVRITGFAKTGLWVEAGTEGVSLDVPFRSTMRVSFPSDSGAIGVTMEVVHVSDRGIGLELRATAHDLAHKVFEDWASGRNAILHLAVRRAKKAEEAPGAAEPERTADIRRRKKTQLVGCSVLVVEDDCSVARLLKAGLSRFGGSVHVAEDGLAAIDILHSQHVDVVLLDWILPHMTGEKVLDEVRKLQPSVPVAVVSGMVSSPTMRNEVRKMGADEIFPKPFELSRISDWIATHAAIPGE